MIPAFSLALSRVPWNVFGTLTFKGSVAPSEAAQVREALGFFRWVALLERKPIWTIVWALRIENGEAAGRLHLHPLIMVTPSLLGYFHVGPGRKSIAAKSWQKLGRRNGIARFRRISANGDSAVAYAVKESDAGADIYELAKTGRSDRLLFSQSAFRMMSRGKRSGEVERSATNTLVLSNPDAALTS